ncbi:hypothetical protein HNR60_003981 [Rhodopseudomonas rhenobacensis]|uniref:Uncharacterized protein n=1 Tax=Rhodopseudomonas rhenobacensis TaxID=87461 RepID=A0A7W8E1S3_9BRAD|nr:hypothetical protein [Rhodopseudomonas rhenobacensis]MBB5049206.1 hypothetical protein [Rhodopseudomonas rhenobacensis]
MRDQALTTTAAASLRRRGAMRRAAVAMTICGSLLAAPASAQSITDRFKSLFGGSSDTAPSGNAVTTAPGSEADVELTCPEVTIRPGASTYAVGLPGKPAAGNDLKFQATIGRTARECNLGDGLIKAKIGIQGRVIAGPAGAPGNVDVPLRVAVVQEGVQPKTIFTKLYQTRVAMTADGNEAFSLVAEDIIYPAPPAAIGDSYIFYIGFDPQGLKPEPPARKRK